MTKDEKLPNKMLANLIEQLIKKIMHHNQACYYRDTRFFKI